VTDTRHGLYRELRRLAFAGEVPQRKDAAIKSIVADDLPVPALFNQAIPGQHRRRGFRKSNQHAHDPWLQFAPLSVHQHDEFGGKDPQAAEFERGFVTKIDARRRGPWVEFGHDRQEITKRSSRQPSELRVRV
jgi:hypothetical protein